MSAIPPNQFLQGPYRPCSRRRRAPVLRTGVRVALTTTLVVSGALTAMLFVVRFL